MRRPNQAAGKTTKVSINPHDSSQDESERRGSGAILGIISLSSFVLFFVVVMFVLQMVFGSLMTGNADMFLSAVLLAVLNFIFPLIGIVTGLAAMFVQGSNKIVGGIGLALNLMLVIWMFTGHSRPT